MSHVAEQILRAIEAALVAADTAAQSRVYVDRVDPLASADLPAILVEEAPQGERAQESSIHGLEQRDLALAIEKVLANPVPALDALTKGRRITLSQMVLGGEGEAARATRLQYWLISYFVQSGEPDVAL